MSLEYRLADLRAGDDPQAWARALADQGWQIWPPAPAGSVSGAVVTINGEQLRRYSLRRPAAPVTGDR